MSKRFGKQARIRGKTQATNRHHKSVFSWVYEIIDRADIILEILDARFIRETRNYEIEETIKEKGKKLIYIINKADLVDINKLKENPELSFIHPYIFFSATHRQGARDLRNKIKIEAKKIVKLSDNKFEKLVNVGVVGYPNTGKSSIINLLIGKGVARVSPVAGFTKGIQKLKLSNGLMLLDTPGIIPRAENRDFNERAVRKHTRIGVETWDKVRDPELMLADLMKKYPGLFEKYYNIPADGDSEILIEHLGRKRCFLKKHGLVNTDRTARSVLRDWQDGKIKVE